MSHSKIPPAASTAFLTHEENAKFLRIVASGLAIERNADVSAWLRGEMQDLLPHEMLISVHTNLSDCQSSLDLALLHPDRSTSQSAEAHLDPLVNSAYAQWVKGAWRPLLLSRKSVPGGVAPRSLNSVPGHAHSVFVHGVHDLREGRDCAYIMYSRSPVNAKSKRERLFWLALLIPQIDAVSRRCASDPVVMSRKKKHKDDDLNLSSREEAILDLIWRGKTNSNIGAALGISPFTVKNHLGRIFGKIGVTNRTQAATKYGDALHRLWDRLS